jgi:hypothetical protein
MTCNKSLAAKIAAYKPTDDGAAVGQLGSIGMLKCLSDTGRSISQGSQVTWFSTGSNTKKIAVIEQPEVIEPILVHIGLGLQPPPRANSARVYWFGAD